MTAANFKTGTAEEKKRRAEDISLLALNPYFLMRVIVLFLGDVILEVWQGWQQKRKKVEPRQDRLRKFYPFVRASMTVLMRDVSLYLTALDIVRGSPSIYLTWPGYDEVAHHSGPWTSDAFKTLRQYDRVIARIKDLIERKAPRPYDLLILSDHGQAFGHTFLASSAFSTSSLTTEDGRSTTSRAAIWLIRVSGSRRMRGTAGRYTSAGAGGRSLCTCVQCRTEVAVDFELSEQQRMVRDMARDFAAEELRPGAGKPDESGEFPHALFHELASLGLLGMLAPEELGGAGMDALSYCLAIEELSRADAAVAVGVSVTNSVCQWPILG